ncbi:MAG: ATP-binding protein, partial [Candidatus Fimenecus sp.]
MHNLNLNELKIYNRLIQSNNPDAKTYAGLLNPISNDMNTLLEFIKKRFETYPDHSYQHSMRILNYIGNLLGNNIKKLSDTECFCIILAALFHDTAMSQYDTNDINTLRDKHAELSFEIIDDYFETKLNILEFKNRIKNAIKFACASHGYNLDEFHKNTKFETIDTINGDIVRYNLLGYLLRIGDLLDLEQHRTNSFVLSKFKNNYSEEAFNHNIRHNSVELFNYNPNDLSVTVLAQNIEQYKIWSTWFKYLEDDILNANTDLKKYEIFFPKPKYVINTIEDFKLDIEELHFEIDDKGNIWNILSQSIYTDEYDFIRETIQNSIDATLICMYINSSINLNYKSPRFWNSDDYCPNLKVCYSEERNQYIIIDSGIGMNKESLHNFLFKVSGSGYNDYFNREFPFPSIAKFGIGFVSCLINASDIEIYTKNINETLMYKVNLSTNANLAFLEQIENKEFHGTVISLNLKNKLRMKSISKYIKNTFSYPSVKIDCINLDDFVKTATMFNKENEAVECLSHPFKLRDMLNEIDVLNNNKLKPIKENFAKISNIISKTDTVINWLNDNKQFSESYSDEEKFKDFKKLIKEINCKVKSLNNNKLNIPFQLNKLSEKKLFIDTDEYIATLNTFYTKCIQLRNKLNDDITKYPEFTTNLQAPKVEFEGNWHNVTAIFDNDLKVSNIIYDANSDDILDKTGVLFVKNNFVDKSLGIEYSTINGLIFSNGETFKTISKLIAKIEKSYRFNTTEQREDLIFGSMGKYYDVYDEISSYEKEDIIT